MLDLQNRVAVVTGAGNGIGAAIARELARRGAAVVIADIDVVAADQIAAEVIAGGGRAAVAEHDVTSWDSAFALAAFVEREFGAADIVVNNAGVSRRMPLTEMSEDEWDRVLDINLKGQFLTLRALVPQMIARGYGRVVNLSSVVGKMGYPNFSHYCTSKFGVIGLTQSLAMELIPHGITVNAVCPGIVMTPLHDRIVEEMAAADGLSFDEALRRFVSNVPQGRPQQPLDVARMVAFLADEKAANMTGGSYHVDGGMVMD
ncbi:SDR family NAD(P)-dependent oxidoreductase [Solimonas marina]|uniref:SDR family oxidoreductase n=1 Tax=Solimonas marina TaxID=2714601 RepID=A0A969W990_9GAMM|nr:SDR family NAD(P)-dependent oxidoreductase [Solimonas marina]NKF23081.1 SDR family oxidoreductase [Solimonas marina]